ncbi:MAG TPA: DedA family protein [Terriglobales bacterium]|nr:DedA family protein [Terriglobales bacterium]
MHDILQVLKQWLTDWGYWAIAGALLLENAGLPLPGETILILASVLAYKSELKLPIIMLVGTVAATLGDNIGYWIGREGGRPLLEKWKNFFRVREEHIQRGEELLEKHGPVAIFFARFVAGARIVAGPLAGVLRMHWPRFALFNFLGAVVWVSVISSLGYAFGSQADRLIVLLKRVDLLVLLGVVAVSLVMWLRSRRQRQMAERRSKAASTAEGDAREK